MINQLFCLPSPEDTKTVLSVMNSLVNIDWLTAVRAKYLSRLGSFGQNRITTLSNIISHIRMFSLTKTLTVRTFHLFGYIFLQFNI